MPDSINIITDLNFERDNTAFRKDRWNYFKKCGRSDFDVNCFLHNFRKHLLIFSHLNEMSPPGWGLLWSPQAWFCVSSEDDRWWVMFKHGRLLPASVTPHLPFAASLHACLTPYTCLSGAPQPPVKGVWEPVPTRPHVCCPLGTKLLLTPRTASSCISFPLWVVFLAVGSVLSAWHRLFQLIFSIILIATDVLFIYDLLFYRHFLKNLAYINLCNP